MGVLDVGDEEDSGGLLPQCSAGAMIELGGHVVQKIPAV
jgi:hypothetical protein